jgi:hypothetical protein
MNLLSGLAGGEDPGPPVSVCSNERWLGHLHVLSNQHSGCFKIWTRLRRLVAWSLESRMHDQLTPLNVVAGCVHFFLMSTFELLVSTPSLATRSN